MRKVFNVAEILESVDSIVSDNKYTTYDNIKIIDRYKRFLNKNIDMTKNPDNEKIIADAEKALIDKKSDNQADDLINQKNKDTIDTSSEKILVLKDEPKDENANEENTSLEKNPENILILKDVFSDEVPVKENNSLEASSEKILVLENELININKEENNLKELENNYIYLNKKLESLNTVQEEKIKDLNLLLDKFTSKDRYIDLDKKIKLYQEDNAVLRNKIMILSEKETALRLQLSDLDIEKNVSEEKNINFKKSDGVNTEEIKRLNTQIENLLQKNNEFETEISILKKNKASGSTDIDQKIKFYREENAKIILDKSDIERKLENTKNQLSINENNKMELKAALDNLNKILADSNIESSTFINPISIDDTEVPKNKISSEKPHKIKKYLDEDSLDLLVKQIFIK